MAAQRRGAGGSRGTNRRASYHGSSAGVGRLLHTVVRPARRSPLAGDRPPALFLGTADPDAVVGRRRRAVTPSTRRGARDRYALPEQGGPGRAVAALDADEPTHD